MVIVPVRLPVSLSAMSFSQVNSPDGSPPGPLLSVFSASLPTTPYATIPMTRRDGTGGMGRLCDICSKVIGLGPKGSLHSYHLHVKACQKKHSNLTPGLLERARSLPAVTATATVSNGINRSASLSPLIIGDDLHTHFSPTLSPTYSPISPLSSTFPDPGLDHLFQPSAPVQAISTPLNNIVRTTSAERSSGEGLRRDAQNTSQARARE